jgi:hypothetical protein
MVSASKFQAGAISDETGGQGRFLTLFSCSSRIHRNHSTALIDVRPSFSTFPLETLNIFIKVWRVARTINPKTNLGAPHVGFTCGVFDSDRSRISASDRINRQQPRFSRRIIRPTAPRPVLRMLHQLPRHRVRMHILQLLADLLLTPHIEVIEPRPEYRLKFLGIRQMQRPHV